MRTIAAGCMLLVGWGLLAGTVAGQQLSGVFSLTGTAGYQSNPYLDPVVGEWDPEVAPAFFAFDPTVGLAYSTSDLQLTLRGTGRTYPRRTAQSVLPLVRVNGAGHYTLADSWQVGFYGGGGRYRLTDARDAWWALPAVAWRPGDRTTLELRGGVTARRRTVTAGEAVHQTSTVGVLQGSRWLTSRLRGQMSLYRSTGHAATGTTTYGGAGVTAAVTYWWTNRLALTTHAAFEQVGYDVTQTESTEAGPPVPGGGGRREETTTTVLADRLWRVGAEARWTLRSGLTLFTRVQGMVADLEAATSPSVDGHVGMGVRWQMARTLAGPQQPAAARELWRNEAAGLRFRVRYAGAGQLYVTGDFNNWNEPGIPLRRVDSNRHAVALSLDSGRYEYRIRIVEGGETRWLPFPDAARTVSDGFGGVNGVCIVE